MSDISQFASFDQRAPIERLSRSQLWRIASAQGLQHRPGATKIEMIQVLQGAGIDVTSPVSGVQWKRVQGRDENGHARTEMYPVAVPPTPKVQAPAEVPDERLRLLETEIRKLTQENAALKALLSNPEDGILIALDQALPWQLKLEIEKRGLKYEKGMKKEDMLRVLKAQ